MRTNLRYCVPCKIVRPMRTIHCYQCDVCITGYDHHCPWVGKCIGKSNMCQFQCFLCSVFVIFIILGACMYVASLYEPIKPFVPIQKRPSVWYHQDVLKYWLLSSFFLEQQTTSLQKNQLYLRNFFWNRHFCSLLSFFWRKVWNHILLLWRQKLDFFTFLLKRMLRTDWPCPFNLFYLLW